MGEEAGSWSPIGSPLLNSLQKDDDPWRNNFDNSVNAVSFGFVATAILISMFLVMAIFERFLRPTSPAAPTTNPSHADLESHLGFNPKLGHPSPKMTVYANGVSVLMPGDHIPTFIAHPVPAPVPCPHEPISWPHHQHNTLPSPTANFNSNPPSST
ncbi:hypothetical protein LWI28_000465 [Acer negundo]|uniref:Uncharacterized protein n=1 Tax=Acer negundo TaxID=4023 RepID=A0AAD5JMQ7_ACENE|nr:hypothetical protein LWI28_000465 [Acer negundo]KAK4858227.1 hypothetical protein QYF36_013051 [Acer negundo]